MANNYQLNINKLEVKTIENGLTDVVFLVHFSYVATTADEEYTDQIISVASVAEPDPNMFVEFENLTEAQVESWVSAAVDLKKYREYLDDRINEKIAPPSEIKDVPW